jgi:MFS transporter, SP family, solute carrier family 2 (myo-inositol transporter), member 13
MAFFAFGPGVCVWLALSELMPTRIRSNGMSIALVINQLVSTTLAASFCPSSASTAIRPCSSSSPLHGGLLPCRRFLLPETKGKNFGRD